MREFRYEPRHKPPVTPEEHKKIAAQLKEAQAKSADHLVLYDLAKNEDRAEVRRKFQFVAEKEGINLKLVSLRGQNTLRLTFPPKSAKKATPSKRMSAEQARHLIIEALRVAKKPLARQDIIDQTHINASSWNIRIKELVDQGLVKKIGTGRETKYELK